MSFEMKQTSAFGKNRSHRNPKREFDARAWLAAEPLGKTSGQRHPIIPARAASIVGLAAALMFGGCAQYASISEKRPQFRPVRATVGALASVEQKIADAMRQEKRKPLVAMGELLTAADTAAQQARAKSWRYRGTRGLQLRGRANLRSDQASEARSVDAAAACAGRRW